MKTRENERNEWEIVDDAGDEEEEKTASEQNASIEAARSVRIKILVFRERSDENTSNKRLC